MRVRFLSTKMLLEIEGSWLEWTLWWWTGIRCININSWLYVCVCMYTNRYRCVCVCIYTPMSQLCQMRENLEATVKVQSIHLAPRTWFPNILLQWKEWKILEGMVDLRNKVEMSMVRGWGKMSPIFWGQKVSKCSNFDGKSKGLRSQSEGAPDDQKIIMNFISWNKTNMLEFILQISGWMNT